MTEPSAPRPVPGPGRLGPGQERPVDERPADATGPQQDRFADLEGRPVAEHVEVFEAEHDRLQSELGTIDRV
jgi:hypothetical protein